MGGRDLDAISNVMLPEISGRRNVQADSVFKSSNFGQSKAKNALQLNQVLHKSKSTLGQMSVSESPGYDSDLVNSYNTSRTN